MVPADTPVTTPVEEIVATAVFDDTHGLTAAAVAEPVRVKVAPTQIGAAPVIVGKALMVTLAVVTQPFVLV